MSAPNICIFPTLEALSEGAADHVVEIVAEASARGEAATIALSGGETPRGLYGLLATPAYARRMPWKHLHLFQVDERPVPPDDPQSNYRMIREALLDPIPEAAAQFHRIQADQPDQAAAAREYEEEIRKTVGDGKTGWPRFDLIILGMGQDGHTASLFPSSPALSDSVDWVTPNYVARLRTSRVTLTFPVLNAAREVIFLVAGEEKAGRLMEVIEGPPDRYPAQRVQPELGRLWWYVDEAAAELLSGHDGNRP